MSTHITTILRDGELYAWKHHFLSIKDEIPGLFQEAGIARCVTHADTGDYLVHIELHHPLKARSVHQGDGTSKITVNKIGSLVGFPALVSRWPKDGDKEVRLWVNEWIIVFRDHYPEGRGVEISELRELYRELARAIPSVWEII